MIRLHRWSLAVAVVLGATGGARAQPAHLVRDINTTIVNALPSNPQALRVAGGRLYYSADDGQGREPWTYDANGARLLLDVSPGGSARPFGFVDFAGAVYFTAESNGYGRQIWRTDGTTAGTTRVTDVAWSTAPTTLVPSGGILYFTAGTPAAGVELWRSDGTAAGTAMVRDIQPGPANAFATGLTDLNGVLIFSADDGASGIELWRSDGSAAGTTRVADLDPGTNGSRPGGFTLFGGRLFFFATLPQVGGELWVTDGTAAGTALVKDTRPGPEGGVSGPMVVAGNTLFFSARTGGNFWNLWKSDGTTAGTVEVPSTTPAEAPLTPQWLTALGPIVYFSAQGSTGGRELWRSDGTAAGTMQVTHIQAGIFGSSPELLTAVGNRVYFTANRSDVGREFWSSDGTAAGTTLVADVKPGPASSVGMAGFGQEYLVAMGSAAFFVAEDAVGRELWRADASGASLARPRAAWARSGLRGDATALGDQLLFVARDERGYEMWRTDGTAAGTALVKDICPEPCVSGFGPSLGPVIGDSMYFSAFEPAHGGELWTTDGTEAGTRLLVDLRPGPDSTTPGALTAVGSNLFFSSDGTFRLDTGTLALARIGDFVINASNASSGADLGGRLIVGAGPLGSYDAVYRSDGTPAGTVQVNRTQTYWPTSLRAAPGQVFLSAITNTEARELWRTDGTIEGTRLVRDVCPGTCSGLPDFELFASLVVGDRLYFYANDGTHGAEVWVSDGTADGTRLLRDVRPGAQGSDPIEFAELGGIVYWTADDGTHGRELWRSDGTESGTFLVKDIMPGRDWGAPYWRIFSTGARLLFQAYQPATGVELWESDGTASGTRMLQEFWPGPMGGGGYPLGLAGGYAYLSAADEATGAELWALPAGPRASVADAHVVEGDGGGRTLTFQVRVDGSAAQPVVVAYETRPGSATGGSDFTPAAGSLTFAPGVTSLPVVVPVVGDLADEADETMSLRLTGGDVALRDDQGFGLIEDDDGPRLAALGGSAVEGDSGTAPLPMSAVLQTKDGLPAARTASFQWLTSSGTATAGRDFEEGEGVVSFDAGTPNGASQPIAVAIKGDAEDEPDESLSVAFRPADSMADVLARATGTIRDDDGLASGPLRELGHGSRLRTVVAADGANDWFVLREDSPRSYEVVLEDPTGDLDPLALRRLTPDGLGTVTAQPIGTGSALSLRWFAWGAPDDGVKLRVQGAGCAPSCGPDDAYGLRVYDTTLSVPRLLNGGTTRTVLILFNPGSRSVSAVPTCWTADGRAIQPPTSVGLGPKQSAVLDTSAICPYASSATISHDGGYGGLVGKAVTFDATSGLSLDTPMTSRPR